MIKFKKEFDEKGDLLELEIEKYAFEGKGIAKIDFQLKAELSLLENNSEKSKYVIFVNGSYPGDIVQGKLTKIKKTYSEAKVEKVIKPSDYRIKARCKFFGTCGGCKQQDLDYSAQIKFKQQQVEEIFNRLGGLSDFVVKDIIPSEKIFYYRNKMEFSFSDRRWLTKEELNSEEVFNKDFSLGLHISNIYDKVLDIDECFLQSEISNGIVNFTRNFFKERNVQSYSTKTSLGYLRNLVIKQSHHTNDLMVNLVTASENEKLMNEYTTALLEASPEITTVINNINLKKASVAIGDFEKVFYGNGFIYDFIGEYKFRISANSFFQTNTAQAEKLYKTALDFAELKGNEIVYDLYSGAGTIAIFISRNAKEVYGFENVSTALSDAEENKRINNIKNVHFLNADLYKSFLPKAENLPKPDVVILDPPRSGMHKNTIEDVIKLNPERIVYVSCNPTTQVRDIKLLTDEGYKLIKIRPVDMFPHSYHIENVAQLITIKR